MRVERHVVDLGDYAELMRDRSRIRLEFRQWLLDEPAIRGRVLDIGCGRRMPRGLEPVAEAVGQLDGVDISPQVHENPLLTDRWQGAFEELDLPEGAWDMAYAYNVLEHVRHARPFFAKLRRVLKPGGVFWALTPHANHPFCSAVRIVQWLGLKKLYARHHSGTNEYPSYYRLNSIRHVCRAIADGGFASARFYQLPCMQWDTYFPRILRWAPHLYDRLLGIRVGTFMQLLAMRLERESTSSGPPRLP